MRRTLLILFFLLLSVQTISVFPQILKPNKTFEIKRYTEYKSVKYKDYSNYLIVKEEPEFKIPNIKYSYSNSRYSLEISPWGELTKKDAAIGFQVKIEW